MNAHDWAGGIASGLLPQVANKQPFEVDLFAQEYVSEKLDAEMKRRVAACAYEFGREQAGVRNVLRDEMLRARNQDAPGTGGRDGSG